jgi:hypothetical protein
MWYSSINAAAAAFIREWTIPGLIEDSALLFPESLVNSQRLTFVFSSQTTGSMPITFLAKYVLAGMLWFSLDP